MFRQTNDRETARTLPTVDVKTLRHRLENILKDSRFTADHPNNGALLNPEAIEQFEKLLLHVDKGCLSDIPPCGSTSTNENLHQKLNSFFNGEKMGPSLAAALLGFLVYSWNCKRGGAEEDQCHLKKKKGAVKSISRKSDCGTIFGQHTKRFNEQETFSSPFLLKLNIFRKVKSLKRDKSKWSGRPFAVCFRWTTKDVESVNNDCPIEHTL